MELDIWLQQSAVPAGHFDGLHAFARWLSPRSQPQGLLKRRSSQEKKRMIGRLPRSDRPFQGAFTSHLNLMTGRTRWSSDAGLQRRVDDSLEAHAASEAPLLLAFRMTELDVAHTVCVRGSNIRNIQKSTSCTTMTRIRTLERKPYSILERNPWQS